MQFGFEWPNDAMESAGNHGSVRSSLLNNIVDFQDCRACLLILFAMTPNVYNKIEAEEL